MACPHGMPTPESRLECMEDTGLGATPHHPERADSRPFASKFDGRCQLCDSEIFAGQMVVHTTEDRFVHVVCVVTA